MPSISSQTIFHFTNKEGLLGILETEFEPRYSRERAKTRIGEYWDYWVPVVCFCDIPLHLINDHIAEYGRYGIGLNRNWAIRNKLNPVLYYTNESSYFEAWDDIIGQISNEKMEVDGLGIEIQSINALYEKNIYLFQNFKPYFGWDFKLEKEKVFYNEKEWRYIPIYQEKPISLIPDSNKFKKNKNTLNNNLKNYKLTFEPNDINYIVIERESERYELLKKIKDIKRRYSYKDVEILASKIISAEQIENDL